MLSDVVFRNGSLDLACRIGISVMERRPDILSLQVHLIVVYFRNVCRKGSSMIGQVNSGLLFRSMNSLTFGVAFGPRACILLMKSLGSRKYEKG